MSGKCPLSEMEQVQLRAQILVYGALLQGSIPEERLMVGAFSATTPEESSWSERRDLWEAKWLKARELAEAVSRFPEPEVAPVPVQAMPTATRSALTVQPQQPAAAEPMEIAEDGAAADDGDDHEDGRERKRAKVSSERDRDGIDEVAESLRKQEEAVQLVKRYVEDVGLVTSSIVEISKSLRPLVQERTYDQASLKITLEAAFSAANAAAVVTSAAYEAALRAKESNLQEISSSSQDEEPELSSVTCAVGIVFKAVSQAQTALKVGNSLQRRDRQDHIELYSGKNAAQEALSEGVTIEVMPGRPGLWLTAKVYQVKDGEVEVEYPELLDDRNRPVRKWLSSDVTTSDPPRFRLPYPTFDLNEKLDDEPKRWTVGDHVDARLEYSWREGIVIDVESDDEVKVLYLDDGCVESVKSNNIRPSLLWKGNKWVLWKPLYVATNRIQKEAASSSPDIEISAEHTGLGETGPLPNHKMRKLVDVILEETEAAQRREQQQQQHKGRIPSKVNKAKKLIGAAKSNNSLQSKLALTKGHEVLRQFVKLKSSRRLKQ